MFNDIQKRNFQSYIEAGAMNSHQEKVVDLPTFKAAHSIPAETNTLLPQRIAGIVSQYTDTRNPALPNLHNPMSVHQVWRLCHLIVKGQEPEPPRIGGIYVEAVSKLGDFPSEYLQVLALRGLSTLMNEGKNRDVWFADIKSKMDNNPELGYLSLTRSPRPGLEYDVSSFFYYMHGTMVGLLMEEGKEEEVIFKEVTKHNWVLRAIALEMSWGSDNKYLTIDSDAMIKLAQALLNNNYGGIGTIDFGMKEFPTSIIMGNHMNLPVLQDAGPSGDALIEYKGEMLTQREVHNRFMEEIKAVIDDQEVKFILPDSSELSKDAAVRNLASTLGITETDALIAINALDRNKRYDQTLEIIKGRTTTGFPLTSSFEMNYQAEKCLGEGKPETVKGNGRQQIVDNGKHKWPSAKSRKGSK